MIPKQYMFLIKAGLVIAALSGVYYVYTEIREKGQLEVKVVTERENRKRAEAERDEARYKAEKMAVKLREFQQIDRDRQREIDEARRRTDRAMRDLEDIPRDTASGLCLDTPIPDSLADRMREAASGVSMPYRAISAGGNAAP